MTKHRRVVTLGSTEKVTVYFAKKSESKLMRLFAVLLYFFDKDFLNSCWTTLFNTIYVPGDQTFDDTFLRTYKSTIIHECTHVKQMKKYHIFFILTYLLPPFLSYGRYYWEREAYYNQLKSYSHNLSQKGLIWQIEAIADVLSSRKYLWAWPKKSIIKWYHKKFNLPL